jgi:lysophospholipase L1-like esterase
VVIICHEYTNRKILVIISAFVVILKASKIISTRKYDSNKKIVKLRLIHSSNPNLMLIIVLIIIIFCITFLVLAYYTLYRKIAYHVPDTFPTAENRTKIDRSKTLVVCFGDSNTHGNVSYDWVNDLTAQMPDYQFINAGKNSDLTYTLLNRIDDVIACKPDFVNILIGTNDVNATMNIKMEKRYQDLKRIDKNTSPSYESFCKNYSEIIQILQTQTQAKILVMSLPIMGEDLEHEANLKADKYSEFIKKLADNQGLIYLPLRESQKEYIKKYQQKPIKHRFEETYKLLNYSVILHEIFGKSWDEITTSHGFLLTPDNLHQNSIAGGIIRDLLKSKLQAP